MTQQLPMLSEDHIASVYWLAQRYADASINTFKNDPAYEFKAMSTMYYRYTRADGEHCVLCISALSTVDNVIRTTDCSACIHSLTKLETVNNIACKCLDDSYYGMIMSNSIKDLVKNMHKRSKYLFKLLDQYHDVTCPKPKRKYTKRIVQQ
jgi:hypothetical protein